MRYIVSPSGSSNGSTQSDGTTGDGLPSDVQAFRRKKTGMSSAVSLSQYWNAWTKVMLRMPPDTTLTMTMTATRTVPTHPGAPVTVRIVSPAPWNCGIRYSQPTPTTSRLATVRTAPDCSRTWAKSGIVYAPERRSGAATRTSRSR